jgi:ribosomal protein S18
LHRLHLQGVFAKDNYDEELISMPRKGRGGKRRKVCQFCVDKIDHADYKDVNRLS